MRVKWEFEVTLVRLLIVDPVRRNLTRIGASLARYKRE